MANPAVKNGYIPLAKELVREMAKRNITGSEMRIIWVILDKTWGWQQGSRKKDSDWIALSQFEEYTGMKRANCVKPIQSLLKKRIILRKGRNFQFNQNFDEWRIEKRTDNDAFQKACQRKKTLFSNVDMLVDNLVEKCVNP